MIPKKIHEGTFGMIEMFWILIWVVIVWCIHVHVITYTFYIVEQLKFVYLPYVGDTIKKKFFMSPFNPVSPPQNALYKNSGTLDILPEESHLNRREQTQQINWVLLGTEYGS